MPEGSRAGLAHGRTLPGPGRSGLRARHRALVAALRARDGGTLRFFSLRDRRTGARLSTLELRTKPLGGPLWIGQRLTHDNQPPCARAFAKRVSAGGPEITSLWPQGKLPEAAQAPGWQVDFALAWRRATRQRFIRIHHALCRQSLSC